MLKTAHQPLHPVRFLACILVIVVTAVLLAPDALAACNKKGKGKDCNLTPVPPGDAVFQVIDDHPCMCTGFPRPEFEAPPMVCHSGQNTFQSGEYGCDLTGLETVAMMTHHMVMVSNRKSTQICNSLAFDPSEPGTPDSVAMSWTDDCSDGSCGLEVSMDFSGEEVMSFTGGAADTMSLVLYGEMQTGAGFGGDPFAVPQSVAIESIDVLFTRPGSTRIAGMCTFYTPDDSIVFESDPVD